MTPAFANFRITVKFVPSVLTLNTLPPPKEPPSTVNPISTSVAALVLLLVNATTAPAAGAAALSVTVPVLFAPPVSVPGFTVIETRAATEVVSRVVVAVAVALGVAVAVAGGVGVTVAVGVGAGASKPLTRMSWPFALKEPNKKSPVTGSMHAHPRDPLAEEHPVHSQG